jgi:hypothetical protein
MRVSVSKSNIKQPPKHRAIAVAAPVNVTLVGSPSPRPIGLMAGITMAGVGVVTATHESKYPVVSDPEALDIAKTLKGRCEEFDALEGSIKADKDELKAICLPLWLQANAGLSKPLSSMAVPSGEGGEILITFPAKYSPVSPDSVKAVIGDKVNDLMEQVFTVKIDGSKLPQSQATQDAMNDIVGVFTKHGLPVGAIEFKTLVKPKPTFHVDRHTVLTAEQNLQLAAICKIQAMVKTKGRGKK